MNKTQLIILEYVNKHGRNNKFIGAKELKTDLLPNYELGDIHLVIKDIIKLNVVLHGEGGIMEGTKMSYKLGLEDFIKQEKRKRAKDCIDTYLKSPLLIISTVILLIWNIYQLTILSKKNKTIKEYEQTIESLEQELIDIQI